VRGAARGYEISAPLAECCVATTHAAREAIVARIHKVEHEADCVIAEVYEALNRTFVTPLDRSDIYCADIRDRCELLDSLESEGDRIYRTQLAAMFRTETDSIRLIKHKEFLEGLERTLDACEDVGGALRTIVIKNA
jgi:uncharacterized protein